ncbi:MAG: fatty acid desaturase family protein [Candidatus Kapaibacteriota bacterium]
MRTLIFLSVTTALLFVQWNMPFNLFLSPVIYILSLYLAITVAVIAHNHNHLPTWKNQTMNTLMDYWITLFYGFPVFAWIPTHNRNHHHYTNREGDHTITYRFSEKNNLMTLLSYPAISSYFQQHPIVEYLRDLRTRNRTKFYQSIGQYVALGVMILAALLLDWKKAILFVLIPHQVALFSVLIFNYIQHVHADEESEYNHSRNFVSKFTNICLFNNGLHTAHHLRANTHWSEVPALHAKIEHLISPDLKERGFWPYIIRVYIGGLFVPKYRGSSMRLERIARMKASVSTSNVETHEMASAM